MITLESPLVLAPMAGLTDTAFRRLVKRQGGCGLVVTEMVSSEAIIRGIDRTLEYAEYTEDERPVAVQIFGGDPDHMAEAATVVERLGADVVDINMGCPVPKIARNNAGCSLMREPDHAAAIVRAMAKAVRIPVTVKMRAGWNDASVNAPVLAKMVEEAGAAAVAVHGRTAAQAYHGKADWELIGRVARAVSIPVYGSGDQIDASQIVETLESSPVAGVLVGRGILRNPWLFAQVKDLLDGRPARAVTVRERGQFLLDYMGLLIAERVDEPDGFRHRFDVAAETAGAMRGAGAMGTGPATEGAAPPARGRERWVINKMRALCGWYTKGLEGGARLRVAVNQAESIPQLRDTLAMFFAE